MAGHNKWAKVKRLKAVTDLRRGKVFSRLARDITMAAKSGGGDPAMNPRLRTILLKAREANMPTENIDRAIKKGTGDLPGVVFEEITYEGYGPGGVAVIVKVTTDNKNRAAPEVRSVFIPLRRPSGRRGGGFLPVPARRPVPDREGGSRRGRPDGGRPGCWGGRCHHHRRGLRGALQRAQFRQGRPGAPRKGIKPESAEIAYIPTSTMPVTDVDAARTLAKLQEGWRSSRTFSRSSATRR